jgi:3-methylcrotonyl-CoA carboxylase alpha subunit
VAGPKVNTAFLHALLQHPEFAQGRMDTGLIGRELDGLTAETPNPQALAHGVEKMLRRARADIDDLHSCQIEGERGSPWGARDGFQLGTPRTQRLTVLTDGVATEVEVSWGAAGPHVRLPGSEPRSDPPIPFQVADDSNPFYVLHDMRQTELAWPTYEVDAIDAAGDGASIRAPIVGRVARVFVKPGEAVARGDRIAVVEAMKMEHVLHAPRDGVIAKVAVAEGRQVEKGALIAALEG